MRPEFIIIHHSLTKDSGSVSWGAIRRYHTDDLGWCDIGYHFGIERVGDHREILVGRLPYEAGAHCKEERMNYKSLGICCVGNFDETDPPKSTWQECVRLVKYLMEVHRIEVSHVLGHGELATYKTCPGRRWDMSKFRYNIQGI